MQNFITAFKAENIKKKGTGTYIVAAILGLITPLLYSIVTAIQPFNGSGGIAYNYYIKFINDCLEPFVSFFFPLMIIITVSRITQLDHKNGGWQLMEVQPVTKLSIFFSKFSIVLIANLISIATLIAGSYLFGWITSFIVEVPENAVMSFQFTETLHIMLRLFVAGLFFTALQYIISVLLSSFIWSILIGFFLLLAYLFLTAFNVVPDWYPLEILAKVSQYNKGSDLGYWLAYSSVISLLCSLIALYIGFEWYKHKRLKLAFGTGKRFVLLIAVIIVLGGALVYVLTPNVMPDYNKTVIAGKVDTDRPIKNIYVRDLFIEDTLAVIPITDNKFHYVIEQEVPLDHYQLIFDDIAQAHAIFSTNDSTYIEFEMKKNQTKTTFSGTRLAENQYNSSNRSQWSSANYYIQRNEMLSNADFVTKAIIEEWEEAMNESDNFKTVDNYTTKPDFKAKNKKIVTLFYLNLWNTFLKRREALFPDEETVETADIKAMKKTVPLDDESLLSNDDYFTYVSSQMIAENKEDIDENTKSLLAINKMPESSFKDKMLYKQLKKSFKEASNKKERDSLAVMYANEFQDERYTNIILYNKQIIEKLAKGKPAPIFEATTLDNKPFISTDLKGKYIIIDVWATWCGPCKYQSPYFEKFAVKYKKENIQFVALSIDDRIDNWFVDAKSKSKSVLQLHVNDKKQFSKNYNANSIPRFILIDPDGNLINAEMPYPNSPVFEQLLRQNLGLDE